METETARPATKTALLSFPHFFPLPSPCSHPLHLFFPSIPFDFNFEGILNPEQSRTGNSCRLFTHVTLEHFPHLPVVALRSGHYQSGILWGHLLDCLDTEDR